MAWERSFESRVHKIRDRELTYQKLNYTIEVCVLVSSPGPWFLHCANSQVLWNAIWYGSSRAAIRIVLIDSCSCVQEWIPYSRYCCFFLAFHCCSSTGFDAFNRFHFGESRIAQYTTLVLLLNYYIPEIDQR